MPDNRIRLAVPAARALAERALAGLGYAAEEACIIADHVVDAALCGYEYSGLAKILNIPDSPRFAAPRRPMTVLRETEISTLYDGGNEIGMLTLHHAATAAIAKATSRGARGGAVRRHAPGARHQPDRLRPADIVRSRRLRHGHRRLHDDRADAAR